MAAQTPHQWGVTQPISVAQPTEKDIALNDSLVAELKRQNNFESPEETKRRSSVLESLHKVTVEFVRHIGTKKGLSQTAIDEAGGKIFTFGSFRLGVFGPGSDIDTLVAAPKHVTRDDFFEHFPTILQKMAPANAVEEMKPVPDAFVPIIKLEYSGISIDLIFARLLVSSVPPNMTLKDKSLLRGLDEVDLRCLNGTRVTDEMLSLVPEVKTFRHALRAIKLWAQRRAIYSNVMGFPGGVAWAMMVARICQLYPHATGSVIVGKFFNLLASWPWPRPIMLKEIEDGPLQVRIWNPLVYASDKHHLMPIITPAYPSMCATHNITNSTKEIIVRELKRASEIANNIMDGKADWKSLFQRHTFFTKGYKYYLSIVSASKTKDAQLIWSGLVESKVRRLVMGIESSQAQVELAHPFKEGFQRVHRAKTVEEIDQVLQGSLEFQAKDIKTETTAEANDAAHVAAAEGNADNLEMPKANGEASATNGEGVTTVYTTTYYVGIELTPDAKSLDISYPVNEFKRQCTDWQQYNPDLNSIRVVHIRNYDLPADVFEPGETRPERAKKNKAAKANDSASKKRTFAAANLEETNGDAKRRHSETTATALPATG